MTVQDFGGAIFGMAPSAFLPGPERTKAGRAHAQPALFNVPVSLAV